MASIVPIILVSVPCVFVVWLLWYMRDSYKSRAQSSVRGVVMPPPRRFVRAQNVIEQQAAQPKQTRTETPQAQAPSAFFRFTIGERYVLDNGCVLECLGIRGKRERRAGFYDYGWLEYYPDKRNQDADYYEWHAIRTDGSAEVCDRGRIRADRVASSEQSAEWAEEVKGRFDGERAYWAKRKEKRERDAKRLAELEKLAKEHWWE